MKRLNVILGKKQLVAAGLTVLLGTAVAVNFIYSGGKDKKLTEPAAEVSGTTYGEADLVSVDKSGEAADSSAYFAQGKGSTSRAAARKQPRCSRACIRAAT